MTTEVLHISGRAYLVCDIKNGNLDDSWQCMYLGLEELGRVSIGFRMRTTWHYPPLQCMFHRFLPHWGYPGRCISLLTSNVTNFDGVSDNFGFGICPESLKTGRLPESFWCTGIHYIEERSVPFILACYKCTTNIEILPGLNTYMLRGSPICIF